MMNYKLVPGPGEKGLTPKKKTKRQTTTRPEVKHHYEAKSCSDLPVVTNPSQDGKFTAKTSVHKLLYTTQQTQHKKRKTFIELKQWAEFWLIKLVKLVCR